MPKKIHPFLSLNINEKSQREAYSRRWEGPQRRIGITGGIASGKSSVGKYLKEIKQLPLLDADIYAKDILSPGTEATKQILDHFGKDIIIVNKLNKKEIDRFKLAEIIFSNSKERIWLESLIHPLIKVKLEKKLIEMNKYPIIVMIIPLLFEVKLMEICSEIWVVDCSIDKQLKRLMLRNNLSKEQAQKRIVSQLPLYIKKELADVIIDNNNKLIDLEIQIEKSL